MLSGINNREEVDTIPLVGGLTLITQNYVLIPILHEDAPNYITNRKGRKGRKEITQEIWRTLIKKRY